MASLTINGPVQFVLGEDLKFVSSTDQKDAVLTWYKNDEVIKNVTGAELLIKNAKKSDEGVYYATITVDKDKVKSNLIESKFNIVINGYIHDLKPGRDSAFTYINWWVVDEILKAKNDGFDWVNDPANDRFKYKDEIKLIAASIQKYKSLEMQESRNGYIISKSNLVNASEH